MITFAGDEPARELGAGGPRLAIGVTGHRDIAMDDERLRTTVVRELERLQGAALGQRPVVLSCLAEGADRLVARLAVDHLAAELVAVLPVHPRDYRRDFGSAASRREFDALLATAGRRVTIDDRAAPTGGTPSDERARRYALAGAWLVERSSVLVAIWDGKPARGVGGTAQIVGWMVSGRIPRRYLPRAVSGEPALPRAPGRVVHIDPGTCRVAYLGGGAG